MITLLILTISIFLIPLMDHLTFVLIIIPSSTITLIFEPVIGLPGDVDEFTPSLPPVTVIHTQYLDL